MKDKKNLFDKFSASTMHLSKRIAAGKEKNYERVIFVGTIVYLNLKTFLGSPIIKSSSWIMFPTSINLILQVELFNMP